VKDSVTWERIPLCLIPRGIRAQLFSMCCILVFSCVLLSCVFVFGFRSIVSRFLTTIRLHGAIHVRWSGEKNITLNITLKYTI